MFRAGIVLLTTIAVLICPYRCAARSAVSSPSVQVKQGCSCCEEACLSTLSQSDQHASDDDLPQPQDQSDDTCVCICDGAVTTSPTITGDQHVTWIDRAALTALSLGSYSALGFFQNEPPDGIESGLCPRLSMQSLLL